ncbi:MAG: phosphatidylserine decarboxylase family protein [Flavobacteriales bacterium]|nr:phosphatidylserine decarboxylase family protein [Flavobacteriales bacterium]|tara:strand:+ start:669 stop:1343 length:675 start_codon:yes stop_codon:yes gene_type:complete
MKIHKEGYKILKNEILVYFSVNILILIYLNFQAKEQILFSEIFIKTGLFFLPIILFSLFFFRIPKRNFDQHKNKIYAPCDGKVVVIEKTEEKEFYKENKIQISIFMSPLNIHNNLHPIFGKVIYKKYHPGKFLFAWLPKASEENEKNTLVVENDNISILIRQIAGAFAKRIVCYNNEDDKVKPADEIGFIKFGSRVDLFLPLDTKINININDKVTGGQTILATY